MQSDFWANRKWFTFTFKFLVKLNLLMPCTENQMLEGTASSYSRSFFFRGWSQVSCQRCLVKSDAYKLLKEAPLWQSHLWRDDWVARRSELFPSRLPALQLLPVDSIHFRKWIACGALTKSWVSSFVVGSHSYFLIEAFFFLSSSTSRLIWALSDFRAYTFQRYTSLASESWPSQ